MATNFSKHVKDETRGQFSQPLLLLQEMFWEQLLLPPSLLSCFSCLQFARRIGGGGTLIHFWKFSSCLMEAASWKRFLVPSWPRVTCVDFVECADLEREVCKLCISQPMSPFHRSTALAVFTAFTHFIVYTQLIDLRKWSPSYSQRSFLHVLFCLSCSLSFLFVLPFSSRISQISSLL